MSTSRTRFIHCDTPQCDSAIGGHDLKAFEVQRAATRAGWSLGTGSRRGFDYCPLHATATLRRLTEPAP